MGLTAKNLKAMTEHMLNILKKKKLFVDQSRLSQSQCSPLTKVYECQTVPVIPKIFLRFHKDRGDRILRCSSDQNLEFLQELEL